MVRNDNHCHTVTFQYFEVLDQWLIRTEPRRLRPVVMVPFKPLRFDAAVVARHGYEIRRALVDPTLAPALDDFLTGVPSTPAGTRRTANRSLPFPRHRPPEPSHGSTSGRRTSQVAPDCSS